MYMTCICLEGVPVCLSSTERTFYRHIKNGRYGRITVRHILGHFGNFRGISGLSIFYGIADKSAC